MPLSWAGPDEDNAVGALARSRLLSAYLNKFVQEPEARRRGWIKELLRPLRDVAQAEAAAAEGGAARGSRAASPVAGLVAAVEGAPSAQPSFAMYLAVLNASAGSSRALLNEHWAAQARLCARRPGRALEPQGNHAPRRVARRAGGLVRAARPALRLCGRDAHPCGGR